MTESVHRAQLHDRFALASYAARLVLLILLAIAAWRSFNFRTEYEPGPDSSIFMSMAWHANNGRALYKDVWDHKPPLIFALNSAALAVGEDGVNSVRTMEKLFAVAGVAAFFLTVYLAFGRFWLAWLTSLLYLVHFYQLHVFEDGNVTEEYGTILFVAGMAAAVASLKRSGRRRLILCGLAGAAFSLAVLCKEPFLMIVPPWFLCVAWPRGRNWREARNHAGGFLLGAIIPVLIFFGYLLANGAWSDWVDAVAFNFVSKAAAGVVEPSSEPFPLRVVHMAITRLQPLLFARIAAILGLIGLLRWSFVRRRQGVPLVIAASALLSLLATSLGGGFSGHYYLFFVPSLILLCASGIAFVADMIPPTRRWTAAALVALLVPVALDASAFKEFGRRLAAPRRHWQGHWLSEVLRRDTSPNDLIWAPWKPLLYVEAHRLSPTKWHFAFDHLFIDTPRSTAAEKLETLRNDIERHPPRAIVLNTPPGFGRLRSSVDDFLARAGLTTWIAANYRTVLGSRDEEFQLLMLNASPGGAVVKAPESLSETMQLAKSFDAAGQRADGRLEWRKVYVLANESQDGPASEAARNRLGSADAETAEALMIAGLDCLYLLQDGAAATRNFRKVLAVVPDHYGAIFQMAKSLDLEGKRTEARVQWERALQIAQSVNDTLTAAIARARLQETR